MDGIPAVVIVVIALFAIAYPSVTFRYRITLEAEVDGEPRQGSSVIEATYQRHMSIGGAGELGVSFRGEAVVLDLGNRGALFALLKEGSDSRSGPEWIVLKTYGLPGGAFPGWDATSFKQLHGLAGRRELSLESLPMLVRFRDIDDPLTVEALNPFNIAKRFGRGARLTRATLEIVPTGIWPFNSFGLSGQPITTGILRRLAWLQRLNGGYLDGAFAGGGSALSNVLHAGISKRDHHKSNWKPTSATGPQPKVD